MTTCVVGGGIQVSLAFLRKYVGSRLDVSAKFAVSIQIYDEITSGLGRCASVDIYKFDKSPAAPIRGLNARRMLSELAGKSDTDFVFTVFGPSYVPFEKPHLIGFADGWITHPTPEALQHLSGIQMIRYKILRFIKLHYLKSADEIVVETDVAKKGLIKCLPQFKGRVSVIPNTYSCLFDAALIQSGNLLHSRQDDEVKGYKPGIFRILVVGAPYWHKNYKIVPDVLDEITRSDPSREYYFIFTLPEKCKEWQRLYSRTKILGLEGNIETVGRIHLDQCPMLYQCADAVFHPSLLETFSVTYVEAMKMRLPLIVSDFDFSREICGDAAIYFDSSSASSAAEKIIRLANDSSFRHSLVDAGQERLKALITPDQKFEMQMRLLNDFYSRWCL